MGHEEASFEIPLSAKYGTRKRKPHFLNREVWLTLSVGHNPLCQEDSVPHEAGIPAGPFICEYLQDQMAGLSGTRMHAQHCFVLGE